MNKLNLKLILIQFFGILFLIYGTQRFFYSFYSDEIIFYFSKSADKIEHSKYVEFLGKFLWCRFYWALGMAVIGVIVIAFINIKRKNHFLNTILVALLLFAAFFSGIILTNLISKYFNYLEELFSKSYTYTCFIGGVILTLTGSMLIWKSFNLEEAHSS